MEKKALKELITMKGNKEAFKTVMMFAVEQLSKKYKTLDIEDLSEMAYDVALNIWKQNKLSLAIDN